MLRNITAPRQLAIATLLGAVILLPHIAAAREWTDSTGKFRIEAELVTIKDNKAYLEKADGSVVQVRLAKLSRESLTYLAGLPEYHDYFSEYPLPGSDVSPELVTLKVDNESQVGEIRRFPDLGWAVVSLAFSPDAGFLAAGIAGIPGSTGQSLQVFRLPAEVAQ